MNFLKLFSLSMCMTFISVGCVVNNDGSLSKGNLKGHSQLLESGCVSNLEIGKSRIFEEIKREYDLLLIENWQIFNDLSTPIYTLEKPLIMNVPNFEKRYEDLIERHKLDNLTYKEFIQEIFDLYNEISRFENQKCAKIKMALDVKKDVRSIKETEEVCDLYFGNRSCTNDEQSFKNLDLEKKNKLTSLYYALCRLNGNQLKSCSDRIALFNIQQNFMSNLSDELKVAKNEAFDRFFKNTGNNKFKCQKVEDKVFLTFALESKDLTPGELIELSQYVSDKWSNDKLKISMNFNEKQNVIFVRNNSDKLSFVKSSEPRTVYLANIENKIEKGYIFAHEFGHILGFPDCYVEFYEKFTQSIIYYELDHDHNLMCRVSSKSRVEDSYFDQIISDVCSF